MGIFPASLDSLYEMLACIREKGHDLNMELACEEVLVNIISHGYPQKNGEIFIQCTEKQILIIDRGIPFNPLKYQKKPREIGGAGISLIVANAQVSYRREKDKNITLLTHLR